MSATKLSNPNIFITSILFYILTIYIIKYLWNTLIVFIFPTLKIQKISFIQALLLYIFVTILFKSNNINISCHDLMNFKKQIND